MITLIYTLLLFQFDNSNQIAATIQSTNHPIQNFQIILMDALDDTSGLDYKKDSSELIEA